MDKFKIAIFDHVGKKSGMDCYDGSLMKALNKKDCQTTVFSNFVGINSDKIKYKLVYEGFSNKNRIIKLYKIIRATIQSSIASRRDKVNIVILHLFSAEIVTFILTLIPKLFRLKIVVISHDVSSFKKNDNILFKNIIYNWFSDFIVVHNQYSYDILKSNTTIKNTNKIYIIKHGGYLDHIDNTNIDKQMIRDELGLDSSKRYLLFFGQIKDTKGLDILLKAMSNIDKDIHLIIAGKPWKDDFSSYDRIIIDKQLNDRIIKKIRFIEDTEREKLFFAADLIVLPYKVIYQSGVLLMAMSYGLPIIISDLPANTQIISHENNGFLFKNKDINDLSVKINQYLINEELLLKVSQNAKHTITTEYSWDNIAMKYLDLLKAL